MRSLSGTRICNRYSFIIERELLFGLEGRMVEEVFYEGICLYVLKGLSGPGGLQLWESKINMTRALCLPFWSSI